MSSTKKVSVVMHYAKDTPGTWKYAEENAGRTMRTLYLSKEKVKELGEPQSIKVSVEAA